MTHHHTTFPDSSEPAVMVSRSFAWIIFGLTFGLLVSDYMSRQVLNAVFPLLKSEWNLSDAQLGGLSGIVALMVGLLTFPLSVVADRWGRVRSLTIMAALWSCATLGCGLAQNYLQMFGARFLVGVGEAAYGSVGIAVVLSVFPASMRATLTAAFMAGGMFGSVLGMGLGGALAAGLGWRWSFFGMALFGLGLAIFYPVVVKPSRIDVKPSRPDIWKSSYPKTAQRSALASLVGSPSVIAAYVGSGLQLFVAGAVLVWMPSYLNRYYGLVPDKASALAAGFVLISGVGMIICGMLSDRLCRDRPERKIVMAIGYAISSGVLLLIAFYLPVGPLQLITIACGMFVAAGTNGPAGAIVAGLTDPSVHGTAFATLTLANNLLGMAPGPYLTGVLADRFGLLGAFQTIPLVSLLASLIFLSTRGRYLGDLERVKAMQSVSG